MTRPPVRFTVRHIGRSTIQEIEMTDAPERIWLQDAGQYSTVSQFEVTWCAEPQDDADTEYIRADLASPAPTLAEAMAVPEVAALVEAARWIAENDDAGDMFYHAQGKFAKRASAALAPFTAAQGQTK